MDLSELSCVDVVQWRAFVSMALNFWFHNYYLQSVFNVVRERGD